MASTSKKGTEKKQVGISYWSKDKCTCPVCNKSFEREIMRSGNGRMIAGNLTDELHRNFEPSAKYGLIYPLIYEIGTCPFCYTSLFYQCLFFNLMSFLPYLSLYYNFFNYSF